MPADGMNLCSFEYWLLHINAPCGNGTIARMTDKVLGQDKGSLGVHRQTFVLTFTQG